MNNIEKQQKSDGYEGIDFTKKPLTREQRRRMERIQKEADEVFSVLARQFRDEFLSEDPNSNEVKEIQNKVCAKWKVYCRSKNFKPEALPLMENYCNQMHADYKTELSS